MRPSILEIYDLAADKVLELGYLPERKVMTPPARYPDLISG